MPRASKDITKYSRYFNLKIPTLQVAVVALLLIGFITGILSNFISNYGTSSMSTVRLLLEGGAAGILVVALPAMLTAIAIKMTRRKMQLRNLLFAVLAISGVYCAFLLADSGLYTIFHNENLAVVFLVLINAGIYGYWFFINKVAVGQRRIATLTAAIQPIINILFYIPFGKYLLNFPSALDTDLVFFKLYGGMIVFLAIGYFIIYIMDRPVKKELNISGVALLTSIIGTSLYNLTADATILGNGGVKRDLNIDVLTLKGKKGYKAFFINPDIHYGPFYKVAGSAFPEHMGELIHTKYRAAPFIIHSTVNIDDNPMSTGAVVELSNKIHKSIEELNSSSFAPGSGFVQIGKSAKCNAINLHMNGINLVTLTKAPSITEDIDREVGVKFKELASPNNSKAIIIDAHNSRFESAPKDDLRGIYKGSKYVGNYNDAIKKAVSEGRSNKLKFGSSYKKIDNLLNFNRDIGAGYTSVGIFDFGKSKFALIFLDANNMLPGFRAGVKEHIKKKYGFEAELCTTDTHSVNTLALAASNALGRITTVNQIRPIIDELMESALKSLEPVKVAYKSIEVKKFPLWGAGSRDVITEVSVKIVRRGKYMVPFIIVAGFIIAAWIIYIL